MNCVKAFVGITLLLTANSALADVKRTLDENNLNGYLNSFSKGLPHNQWGVVDEQAYERLLSALQKGNSAAFENVPKGVKDGFGLRNPLAAYAQVAQGDSPETFTMPLAPEFNSAWQAAEATEVMWKALLRDVPFAQYNNSLMAKEAAADLQQLSAFRGPTLTTSQTKAEINTQTLFRGIGPGETVGPYISQFLLKPIPYGATTIIQRYKVPKPGNDHLTNYSEWLHIQNGGKPTGITKTTYEADNLYLYSGRALGEYVLHDFVNMAYLNAALIIGSFGDDAFATSNPYHKTKSQARAPLFGINHAIDLLSRVSMPSQQVAWYQKWLVHRRARPEVFFGHIHNHLTENDIAYPIHEAMLNAKALEKAFKANGTYLLPQASPKGAPLHPTYPAAHAVMAGAAVTMLKAFFKGDFVIQEPVMPSADGKELLPYTGEPLTVESELNKLASNISLGRNFAGVHYRSDGDLGLLLGEAYAISLLKEMVQHYQEDFSGFTFTRFDGTTITINQLATD
ncbi:hypothetical protein ACOJR9_00645 [Alteromonas sp. A081]|uniref:hypothetical protein n=1 Tax=Alteromonas sp. A081 TaxID=3410269 RepID=UPI003B97F40E